MFFGKNLKMKYLGMAIPLLLVAGCYNDRYEYAVNYKDKLREMVISFESAVKENEQVFNKGIQYTESELREDPNVNFKSLAFSWKSRLSKGRFQLERMQDKFESLRKTDSLYFKKLRQILDSIQSPTLKRLEEESLEEFSATWEDITQKGGAAVFRLERLLNMGEDVHKIIVSGGIRQKRATVLKALTAFKKEFTETDILLHQFIREARAHIELPKANKEITKPKPSTKPNPPGPRQ
ncbi:MAG: hypothetical protein OHK0053_16290 [Microscillaceae bacterium]